MLSSVYTFQKAKPIWAKTKENTPNVTISFGTMVHSKNAEMVLACQSSYILLVNGKFVAYGPSRRAHGYYDVDTIDLSSYLDDENNTVSVRVAGYHVNSFSHLDVMPFLCCEVFENGRLIAYTDKNPVGFVATEMHERITRCPRYSFQRPFAEAYRLTPGAFSCESTLPKGSNVFLFNLLDRHSATAMVFLKRTTPYGSFERIIPDALIGKGSLHTSPKERYYADRSVTRIGPELKGYPEWNLEMPIHTDYGKLDFESGHASEDDTVACVSLSQNGYCDISFACDYCGILEMDIEGNGGKLFLGFSELKENGEIKPLSKDILSVIECQMQPGKYHLICAEPYTMKFLRMAVLGGPVTISDIHLIKVAYPSAGITKHFAENDTILHQIYDAAVETFCSNAVDIFMDCPGRERAGWLCDSFFTSRVEYTMTGKSLVEKSFLENFLLPKSFDCLPEGMLPMCYPSDHYDGVYIPNWAMWYVLELGEYITRRGGEKAIIPMAKDRVLSLLQFFRHYENKDGLLEKMDSWVFVEWSFANQLVQDINFPTNMLYAKMKDVIADLFDMPSLHDEANAMRQTIRDLAMTSSGFFCDNMVYDKVGVPHLSGECTETCQYYAFWFDIATPTTYPELWKKMIEDFGYQREKTGLYPEIHPANAFVGNYLRLDLLDRYGYYDLLRDSIRGYFAYMAEQTGTLWENVTSKASCNHGFASHVLYWMDHLGMMK